MRRARRGRRAAAVLLSVLAVGLAAVTLLVDPLDLTSLTTVTESDPATIDSYVVDMTLDEDGNLRAVETITVTFPVPRRGIFRIFDTANPRFDESHPVTDVTVSRDGQPETAVWMPDSPDGVETLRIGQENFALFAGTYTYELGWTQLGVVEPDTVREEGSDATSLWWWDVIGSGWQVPIASAQIRVALPAVPTSVECVRGEDTGCTAAGEGASLAVDVADLAPEEPVTLRVAMPASEVPPSFEAPGDSAVPAVLAVLAGLLGAAVGIYGVRATKESPPGFPVLYEPPRGVRPAVGVWALDERASRSELQATLFDLGDRGVVRIERHDDDWLVRLVADPIESGCESWETAMLSELGLRSEGEAFVVSRDAASGKRIAGAKRSLSRGVTIAATHWLRASKAGLMVRFLAWVAVIALLVIAPMHVFGGPSAPAWVVVGLAALAATASIVAVDGGRSTVRTEEGRDIWSRMGGFARFLSTDSSESRFDAAAHLDWFPHYLPWAFALGVSDEWARRYEAQGVEVPEVPYVYGWYWVPGMHHAGMGSFSSSFDAAISSASAAYAATQASSGGGGGGGFSGGSGGGGGGGGSW